MQNSTLLFPMKCWWVQHSLPWWVWFMCSFTQQICTERRPRVRDCSGRQGFPILSGLLPLHSFPSHPVLEVPGLSWWVLHQVFLLQSGSGGGIQTLQVPQYDNIHKQTFLLPIWPPFVFIDLLFYRKIFTTFYHLSNDPLLHLSLMWARKEVGPDGQKMQPCKYYHIFLSEKNVKGWGGAERTL